MTAYDDIERIKTGNFAYSPKLGDELVHLIETEVYGRLSPGKGVLTPEESNILAAKITLYTGETWDDVLKDLKEGRRQAEDKKNYKLLSMMLKEIGRVLALRKLSDLESSLTQSPEDSSAPSCSPLS